MRNEGAGALRGIFPDLGREIFESLDVPVAIGPELPWKRLLTLLEFGQIDVLAGAYLTRERAEKFGVSRPVMQEEVRVFARTDLPVKPEGLDDLVGLRGVAPFGASFGEEFDTFAAEKLSIDRQPTDDFLTNMRLVKERKADFLILPRQDGERMIGEAKAEGLVEMLPWPAAVNTLHYLFSKTTPCLELLERFDEELQRKLDAGALDVLIQRYRKTTGDG
jgi:ABC-type amino acid transport substrate-binding protein